MAHKRTNACLRAPSQFFSMYDSSVRRVFTARRRVSWFATEAENFESLQSVNCRKNAILEPLNIFSTTLIDKHQNVFGCKM